MCLKDPGYEVDVCVRADLRLFIEAWRGIRDLRAEIRARRIAVIGAPRLIKEFPDWLRLSMLAPYERKKTRTRTAARVYRPAGDQFSLSLKGNSMVHGVPWHIAGLNFAIMKTDCTYCVISRALAPPTPPRS